MRVRATLIIFLAAGFNGAFAQFAGTQYFMNSLPQYVNNNPAFFPRYKFALGLPGSMIDATYANNGFTFNDATRKENGKRVVTLDRLLGSLPDKTYITGTFQVDVFRFGFRAAPNVYFTLNSTFRGYGRSMVPKDALSLLKGNSDYIGKTAHISPELEMMTFWENSAGLALSINEDLTVGARVKLLRGLYNANTRTADIQISVADNYATTLSADMNVRTSGLQSNDQFRLSNFSSNNGLAFDLGATYKLDKFTFAASLVDIGAIKWKTNTYQYTLDKSKSTYTFSGLDINRVVDGDSEYFQSLKDSLTEKFKPTEVSGAAYRTMLPAKMYASANYEIMKNFNAGTVLYAETYMGRFNTGWTLAVNKHFGKVLSTSLSYTIANRSYNNLGAGLSLNLAPVQIYVVGDNLLRLPVSAAINKNLNEYLNNTQVFSFKVGLNFVWGWMQDSGKKVEDESYNSRKRGVKTGTDVDKHPSPDHLNVRKKKR